MNYRPSPPEFKLLGLLARGDSSIRSTIALIKRVGGDPTAHHHHRHARSGMGRPARQVEALQVRTGIGWFEGSIPTAVAGDAVNRSVQHSVSLVNIDGRERALKNDAFFNVDQTGGALELVENHLAIRGKHL